MGKFQSFTHFLRLNLSGPHSLPVTVRLAGGHKTGDKVGQDRTKGDSLSALLCLHMSFCYHSGFSYVTITSQKTIPINHQIVNIITAWEEKYYKDEIFPNEARGETIRVDDEKRETEETKLP